MIAQDLPKTNWELLLVDGGSTDATCAFIQPFLEQYSNIRLLHNPHRTAPYAMNIGIRAAKGEYICRIDAHSVFPPHYVSTLWHYSQELPEASNLGGVCITLPANDSLKAQAISIACSHPLGVGNSTFRTSTITQVIEVDTVPFGFWKKSLFEQVGLFDEELTRNQDDEFNARTIQHGGHIYLVPNISTNYYARDTISKTWKMFYQYGLYKPLVNKKVKHLSSLRQLIPLFFVCGLSIGLPLSFLHPVIAEAYIGCIGLYLLLINSVGIQHKNPYIPIVLCTMHLAYGLGYIHGLFNLLFRIPFNVKYNR